MVDTDKKRKVGAAMLVLGILTGLTLVALNSGIDAEDQGEDVCYELNESIPTNETEFNKSKYYNSSMQACVNPVYRPHNTSTN